MVLQRPAVLGILASIAVIDDPSCELDLWMALKSPLFGCTDIDLVRYRRAGGRWRLTSPGVDANGEPLTGPVADAMDGLRRVRRTMDAPQPVDVIDGARHRTRILQALSYAPRGAFDSDCLRMVRAHAQQFQDDGGVGLPDYLRAVADLRTDSTKSSPSEPDDRDDNAVRLMTIHQAKGLEFPIVVLGAMASIIYNPSPSIGIVERDRYEFSLGKDLRSLNYTEWDQNERQPRSDAERIRLDYVACTRARDHLIVSICGEYGRKTKRHATLLWPSIPAQPDHITALDSEPVVVQVPAEQPPPPLPDNWEDAVVGVRARAKQPFVALPSGTAAAVLGLTQAPGEPSEVTSDHEPRRSVETTTAADSRAARDGRPLGRAVHAALDTMVRTGSPFTPDDVEQACRRACEAEGILDELGVVRDRVASALVTDLMMQALAAERRWSELYLAAPADDPVVTLVEGFADLLFETSDGLVLVDYKTDEVISSETRQHYAGQLATYDELLRLATGRSAVRRVILHLPGAAGPALSIDA